MTYIDLYYLIKPLISRRFQISIRKAISSYKRKATKDVWPIHPGAAKAPEGWSGWPAQKKFSLVLSHDVDTAKGHDRCLRLMNIERDLGFRSSFNFVPERYCVSSSLRKKLVDEGFAVGVHGLTHDGTLFKSRKIFVKGASRINDYLKEWGSVGFHAPSMLSNLDWIADLDIKYSCSTFDTDPFEPQPNGVKTIFPFHIVNSSKTRGYVELPYTLPQDHCLFVILKEKDIKIWMEKLDWIAENGGMALLNTHPDYMNFDGTACAYEEYPVDRYIAFLDYIKNKYAGQYWHALPLELAQLWKERMAKQSILPSEHKKDLPFKNLKRTIWIDLDNTPHVPFFIPIKKELEKRGFRVILTARNAYQVSELAARNGLVFKTIGHHYGKNKIMKVFGWLWRTLQLAPFAIRNKPDLVLSHGSRSQVLLANLFGIPSVLINDYEHSNAPPFTHPGWIIVPDVIAAAKLRTKKVLQYQGLKEDVYLPFFVPDPGILADLGLSEKDLVVTIRPPATEAHYHNPESERIFSELMTWTLSNSDAKIVLLPRNEKQGVLIKKQNRAWFAEGRAIIPKEAINGLNLLYFSDVVISGGGTMNREAAALNVPVYSIFRGPLGEVDRHLEAEGRLTMISTPDEIHTKLKLRRRDKNVPFRSANRPALRQIVDHIEAIIGQETKGKRS